MIDLNKELEESTRARENQNLHVREVQKTRTEHKCKSCKQPIPIGSSAKVVSEVTTYNYRDFYKTYYYHINCFLQTYPNYKPET